MEMFMDFFKFFRQKKKQKNKMYKSIVKQRHFKVKARIKNKLKAFIFFKNMRNN